MALPNGAGATGPEARRRSDPSLRVLKSQGDARRTIMGSSDGLIGSNVGASLGPTRSFAPNSPVAFLDLDLTVVRTNQWFNHLFGLQPDHRGRNLDGFIDPDDRASLQEVRNKLREEKDARDPTYLAPLRMNGALDAADNIPSVESVDLAVMTSQGFQERVVDLRFRFVDGLFENVRISIRLARAEVFFAVLILPPASEIIPMYAQQQPRPMPSPSSSYAFTNGYATQAYAGPDESGPAQRGSATNSGPPSPYYTFGPSMQPTTSNRMASAQQSYDPGLYFAPNMQDSSMYNNYTTQSGVVSQVMPGAAAPRQIQAYQPHMQMPFQTPSQPQLLQPGYHLPPINGQGERPRSTGPPPPGTGHMRSDPYGRDQQQAYMHIRDDGQPHLDGTHAAPGSSEKGRGPHLTNLLQ